MDLSNLNLKARLDELEKQGKKGGSTYKKIAKILAENIASDKKKGTLNVQAVETKAKKQYHEALSSPSQTNVSSFQKTKAVLSAEADKRQAAEKKAEAAAKKKKMDKTSQLNIIMKQGKSRDEAEKILKKNKKK